MKMFLAALLGLTLAGHAGAADAPWKALPLKAPAPAANPTTPAKVELGRMLFNDKRLSESETVSCASCHKVSEGGADKRAHSLGVHGQPHSRNTPTVLNVGFLASLFWDGRAATLEEQAKAQLLNPLDMGMKDLRYVAERIGRIQGYRPWFEKAFGSAEAISADDIVRAIAAYERTLVTANTPYDRFVAGDAKALSAQQQRGMTDFRSFGCSRCHQGAAFDGPTLVPGTPFVMRFPTFMRSPYVATYDLAKDQGRFEATGKETDRYLWRVPSLRNLVSTAPYMHNGSIDNLADAIRVMGSTELNRTFTDAEVAELQSFLEALSGPLPAETEPTLPPS